MGMNEAIQKVIENLPLLFATGLGAFTLYILNRLQNQQPFSLFRALKADLGNSPGAAVVFLDMLLSSLIGAAVVCLLAQLATIPQAVVAGLGMTGVLSAHAQNTGDINNGWIK